MLGKSKKRKYEENPHAPEMDINVPAEYQAETINHLPPMSTDIGELSPSSTSPLSSTCNDRESTPSDTFPPMNTDIGELSPSSTLPLMSTDIRELSPSSTFPLSSTCNDRESTPSDTIPPMSTDIGELAPSSILPPMSTDIGELSPSNTFPLSGTCNDRRQTTDTTSPPLFNKEANHRPIQSKSNQSDCCISPPINQPWYVQHQNLNTPWWPTKISSIVKAIISSDCIPPSETPFLFELSIEAAHKNFCVLSKYNFDLGRVIEAHKNSPISYGSEFRPSSTLHQILHLHPRWPLFKSLLDGGSSWPLSTITEEQRIKDVEEALEFTNHKGAINNYDLLKSLIDDDVIHGYILPLPLSKLQRIPGVLLAPLNIIHQNTIDEEGNIIGKDRLTHDQSFIFKGSNSPVNSRLDKSRLSPCTFGWVIKRLVNWIVAARRKFPNRRILATKIDFKSAFRRCHLHAETAIQSCASLPQDDIALVALRLTFGGAACPFEWSVISETICDLASAISHDDSWDCSSICSPLQKLVPPPIYLPDDIPFTEGKELAVDIQINNRGIHEMYIDDLIGLTIDLPDTDNTQRAERAPLLAIHACSRPSHIHEPIPRHQMVSTKKLEAEAALSETKTILGWEWNLRQLIISLPHNKFVVWTKIIEDTIKCGCVSAKEFEQTIGRLNHLALVVPFVNHFLSRLRELLYKAQSSARRQTKIPPNCIDDLHLMIYFIKKANKGINMNQIAYRKPNIVYRSDSCPGGLGGYSHEGFAWRFAIPASLQFRASNNLLEHLAAVITPWIDTISGRLKEGDCALSMTDSTTSEGWLRKSNFREENDQIQASVRILVARDHARRYMDLGIRDYSQWFPGAENNVADSLSRDFHLSDIELITYMRHNFPSQIPSRFEIVPLPNEIVLWLTSLLQQLPVNERFREEHMPTTNSPGIGGPSTAIPLAWRQTSSSTDSVASIASESSEHLLSQCETEDFQARLKLPWVLKQYEAPSITWLRPFGRTTGLTQL